MHDIEYINAGYGCMNAWYELYECMKLIDNMNVWMQDINVWMHDMNAWMHDRNIWRNNINAWYECMNAWYECINAWYEWMILKTKIYEWII